MSEDTWKVEARETLKGHYDFHKWNLEKFEGFIDNERCYKHRK